MPDTRQELVRRIQEIVPSFIYGEYREKPQTPYGLYYRCAAEQIIADNQVLFTRSQYMVRIVTENKDFALESQIQAIFGSLELPWVFQSEASDKVEKVHGTQWLVEILE